MSNQENKDKRSASQEQDSGEAADKRHQQQEDVGDTASHNRGSSAGSGAQTDSAAGATSAASSTSTSATRSSNASNSAAERKGASSAAGGGAAKETSGAGSGSASSGTGSRPPEPGDTRPEHRPRGGGNGGGGRGLTALVVVLLIVLIAAIAAGGWWNWQQRATIAQLQGSLDQGSQQRSQLSSSVQEGSQGIQNLRSQVSRLQSQLEQNDQALQQALNEFSSTQQTDERIWQLAEIEYLLRMANQRLQLERDVSGALALLTTADQRLEAIDNPALLPVRRAVAAEISALEAVPDIDESGLYLRLAALAERVDSLPLAQEQQSQAAQQDSESLFSGGWRQQLARLGEQLQGLVTVRRHDEPLEALITPAQENYLRQNVQLLIEQAQLALMRDNGELYQHALQRAQSLVRSYFRTDSQDVSQLIEQLGTLAGRNITPELPDISDSLNTLREFQQQRRDGASSGGASSAAPGSSNASGGASAGGSQGGSSNGSAGGSNSGQGGQS